jgi:hypothetical protein
MTTIFEQHVGKQMCEMLGYNTDVDAEGTSTPEPWGHLPSNGTIANMESMWAGECEGSLIALLHQLMSGFL